MMDCTLIIGYGNPLRRDDAVGFLAAERLSRTIADPSVTILPVHQLTPELAEPVSRALRVIFIDACVGPEPGEIRERPIRPTPQPDASAASAFSHHASPEALLAAALALYGHAPEAGLFSVAGSDFSYSNEPSPALDRRVDSVAAAVLRRIGCVAPDRDAS
jgi:hydrogenase maturation protease